MSEEKNIPEDKPENIPVNTGAEGENVNEHFPEDSHAPKPAVILSEAKDSNQQQETENMEVHHHGHVHEKKKWKEYLFQFLMLFLAVFCGFLAEYQLEHVIEHQREKIYMASLLEDLVNDTSDLTGDIDSWERVIQKADTLRNELTQQSEARDNKLIYRLASDLNYNNTFAYHDRTIG